MRHFEHPGACMADIQKDAIAIREELRHFDDLFARYSEIRAEKIHHEEAPG